MRFLLIIVMTLILFSLTRAQDEVEFYTEIGQQVPSFEFETIGGERYKIEDFQGKFVLINFFATWCGPCMAEMPKLESDIWQKLKKEDFSVIALGREHTVDELVEFNNEKNFSFIIGADPQRDIFSQFAPNTIPRNYIIDPEGKIVFQKDGFSEVEFYKLTVLVKELIKEKKEKEEEEREG